MNGYRVIGDWGTSNLRLFRVEDGRIVARRDGPGIAVAGRNAEAAFADTVAPWLADAMPLSVTLCGMVGARDGWVLMIHEGRVARRVARAEVHARAKCPVRSSGVIYLCPGPKMGS